MSDAARLSAKSFATKPAGVTYIHHRPTAVEVAGIRASLHQSVLDSSYAAVVSYAEALSNIRNGSISWSIVKLYYSCFYSLRSLILLNNAIPFNSRSEMILDLTAERFLKGGRSSHHWNWDSFNRIASISSKWFTSEDSKEAYENLRRHRENVNYTHSFTDPDLHECLISGEPDLSKRFREYRDDSSFLYTYLHSHLAIAYPTKLLLELDSALSTGGIGLEDARLDHIKTVWTIKDRCPLMC